MYETNQQTLSLIPRPRPAFCRLQYGVWGESGNKAILYLPANMPCRVGLYVDVITVTNYAGQVLTVLHLISSTGITGYSTAISIPED